MFLVGGRFVDQVCMVIDRDVMGGLPSRIHEEMYRNVNDDARLQAYFEEDKQVRCRAVDRGGVYV